jgi:hypothetical protein
VKITRLKQLTLSPSNILTINEVPFKHIHIENVEIKTVSLNTI